MITRTLLLAALALIAAPAAEAGSPCPTTATACSALRPLTYGELFGLYVEKTWTWTAGAAHFANSKRVFTAWSAEGGRKTAALGAWFLDQPGRLCFRAIWGDASGAAEALTCFDHLTDGKTVYQRRAPSGDWYVFRSEPPAKGDEANKLTPGDDVARRIVIRPGAMP